MNWRSLKPSVAVHRLVKDGGEITRVQSAEVRAANDMAGKQISKNFLKHTVPGTGKKTPGGAGTHTGHTGHTGARGHTGRKTETCTSYCTVTIAHHNSDSITDSERASKYKGQLSL